MSDKLLQSHPIIELMQCNMLVNGTFALRRQTVNQSIQP
jgi:hypothetical protein